MARSAVHEERNHGAGARRKQRGLGLQVKGLRPARHVGQRGEEFFLPQQPRESDAADAHRVTREEVAAGPEAGGGITSAGEELYSGWGRKKTKKGEKGTKKHSLPPIPIKGGGLLGFF